MEQLVSVILLAENAEEKHVENAIKNVLEQTYKNLDVLVCSFLDLKELKEKFVSRTFNIRWLKVDPGPDFINEALAQVQGEVIFYKTVNNTLWYQRHIQAHLEQYEKDKNVKWCFSHLEYRNIDIPDHPLNTIGYRISTPPKLEDVSIDEISHYTDVTPNWNTCIVQNPNNPEEPIFLAGLSSKEWLERGFRGNIPPEITVVIWKQLENKKQVSQEEVAKTIGIPTKTTVDDKTEMTDDGDIIVTRVFPTVVGNLSFEDYNKAIREQIEQLDRNEVKSISVKRTVGMGDILLVEPVIKKLKEKYPNSEITFYTAKPQIVDYFVHKPNNVIEIGEGELLKDYLGENSTDHLKYDLDLSYESRTETPFIDAYAQVCGIEFEKYEDKYPQMIEQDVIERDKPICVVCGDGSGWPGKTWDINKYAVVIEDLITKGWEVIETGAYHTDKTDSRYHQCDFSTMIKMISNADLYIGTDNGPMHIARAYKIPSVIIAGAALPYYSNPNREQIFYVQNNNSPHLGEKHRFFFGMINGQLIFVPSNDEDPTCGLKDIQPKHVISAIEKVVGPFKKFYFNIPGHSYYIDDKNDFIYKGDNTHPDQDKDISEEYAPRWEEILENHAKPWVEMIKKYKSEGMFLDVGCNIGCTVKAAMDAGYDAHGCDINKPSIEKAKEIFPEYFKAPVRLHYNSSVNSQFDIITSDQVIEHIEDPVEWLEELKMALNDDGMIFIGTPNFRSKEAQKEWGRWGQVGVGEHIWLPTPDSIDYIMKKAGLNYEHLEDPYKSGGFVLKCWKE